MKLDLIRDILDKQLIDSDETKMGRADGVVIAFEEGEQPVIDHLQLGATILGQRLGRPIEKLVAFVRRKWPVRECAVQVVRWPRIAEITRHHIRINVVAEDTPAFDWEKWLRKHVIEKIPGSSS